MYFPVNIVGGLFTQNIEINISQQTHLFPILLFHISYVQRPFLVGMDPGNAEIQILGDEGKNIPVAVNYPWEADMFCKPFIPGEDKLLEYCRGEKRSGFECNIICGYEHIESHCTHPLRYGTDPVTVPVQYLLHESAVFVQCNGKRIEPHTKDCRCDSHSGNKKTGKRLKGLT